MSRILKFILVSLESVRILNKINLPTSIEYAVMINGSDFIKDEKMTSNYLNSNQIISFLMLRKLRWLLNPTILDGQSYTIFQRRREIEIIFKQIEMINKEISEDAKLIIVYLPTFNEIKTGNNIFSNLVTISSIVVVHLYDLFGQ